MIGRNVANRHWRLFGHVSLSLSHWSSLEEFLGLGLVHGPAGFCLAVLAASLHQLRVRPASLGHWGAAGGLQGTGGAQLEGAGGGGHLQGAGGGGGVPLGAGATLPGTVAASVSQLRGHECF